MSLLFSPLKIRSVSLNNRIVVSPMCQYSATDGLANDWHLVNAGSRAVGGAGLVMMEATAVSPEGRITHNDLGLWNHEQELALKRIASFVTMQGSVPGIQLAHAGRKASHDVPWKGGKPLQIHENAWQTIAPSAIAFKDGTPVPREMDENDIDLLISNFQKAAERALRAGFRVLEIHGAHGYLLHEFLSQLSNVREDGYGGSFNNRIRIVIEIIQAIRSVWPIELPLFLRISATDWVEEGWNISDSIELAKIAGRHGVDLIDCSTGGNVPGVKIPLLPLYQVPFAEQVKKEAGILTGAVGLITTAAEAESILAEQRADLVFMARELLRDPYFPLHAAKELGADVKWPDQYLRAKKI